MTLIPADAEWLALCLVTESNRPEEWPFIAQVIENRRRAGRWGGTYQEVVLAPAQFSAFNSYTKPGSKFHPETIFNGLTVRMNAALLLMRATWFVAQEMRTGTRLWAFAISSDTLHYWSPVSMVPKGRKPAWAKTAKRLYTPDGVDPERFVFAEGVP